MGEEEEEDDSPHVKSPPVKPVVSLASSDKSDRKNEDKPEETSSQSDTDKVDDKSNLRFSASKEVNTKPQTNLQKKVGTTISCCYL
jgi:hypothetical protein